MVSGSSAAAVVFTSYHDDSFGGDTDGTAMTPTLNDSTGILVSGGWGADLSYTHLGLFVTRVSTSQTGGTISLDHVTIDNVNRCYVTTMVAR